MNSIYRSARGLALAISIVCMMVGSAFAFHGNEQAITEVPATKTNTQEQIIVKQIRNRTAPVPEFNAAAGDEYGDYSYWTNVNFQFYDYSKNGQQFDSKTLTWAGGLDYEYGDFLFGTAMTLETSRSENERSDRFKDYGIGLIPYVAYSPVDWFVVDGMVGGTYLYNKFDRKAGGHDTYNSYRTFASVNANGYYDMGGNFILNPFLGYTYSHAHQDKIKTTPVPVWSDKYNSWSGQWRLGLGGLYAFSETVDLNFGLAYYYQDKGGASSNYSWSNRDRDEFEPYLDINFQVSDDFRASIQTALSLGKDSTDAGSAALNFEWAF